MIFKLTNGEEVCFRGNSEAAKFIFLVMPFKGLRFAGEKPTITVTPQVKKYIQIAEKIKTRREERNKRIEVQDFDDDIPF